MSTPLNSDVDVINNRRWIGVSRHHRACAVDAEKFRLLTYNILSDHCIDDASYTYCPDQLRYMSSRHERIVAEIATMQPHVVCLQVSLSTSG